MWIKFSYEIYPLRKCKSENKRRVLSTYLLLTQYFVLLFLIYIYVFNFLWLDGWIRDLSCNYFHFKTFMRKDQNLDRICRTKTEIETEIRYSSKQLPLYFYCNFICRFIDIGYFSFSKWSWNLASIHNHCVVERSKYYPPHFVFKKLISGLINTLHHAIFMSGCWWYSIYLVHAYK